MLFSLATMPKSGDEAEQLANLGEGIGYAVKGAASEMAVYGTRRYEACGQGQMNDANAASQVCT